MKYDRKNRDEHRAEPNYVGCPHCASPVYIGRELDLARADVARVIKSRMPDDLPLKQEVGLFVGETYEGVDRDADATYPLSDLVPPEGSVK